MSEIYSVYILKNKKYTYNNNILDNPLLGNIRNYDLILNIDIHILINKWLKNFEVDVGYGYGGIGKYLDYVLLNINSSYENLYKNNNYISCLELFQDHQIFDKSDYWNYESALTLEEFAKLHYLIYNYKKSFFKFYI